MKTFTCDHCRMDMIPTELNPKADEALCSICGQWFCYNHRNSSSLRNMAPDNATEIVEKIYNGEIDEEIFVNALDLTN